MCGRGVRRHRKGSLAQSPAGASQRRLAFHTLGGVSAATQGGRVPRSPPHTMISRWAGTALDPFSLFPYACGSVLVCISSVSQLDHRPCVRDGSFVPEMKKFAVVLPRSSLRDTRSREPESAWSAWNDRGRLVLAGQPPLVLSRELVGSEEGARPFPMVPLHAFPYGASCSAWSAEPAKGGRSIGGDCQ